MLKEHFEGIQYLNQCCGVFQDSFLIYILEHVLSYKYLGSLLCSVCLWDRYFHTCTRFYIKLLGTKLPDLFFRGAALPQLTC